jgi:hypothetical protein
MIRDLLILAATLLPVAASAAQQAGPTPQPAEWSFRTVEGQRTLRGATVQDPGDRIILMCNGERRLVAMLFRLGEDPEAVAAGAVSGYWLVDGTAQPSVDPRPIIPMNRHTVSLSMVAPELFRRLLSAEAAGFVWRDAEGIPLAGYQIEIASGRALLAEFGRACNAEAYP